MYGVIEYDSEGNPVCEICGKAFARVIFHVRQKHNMNEKEYKQRFGFDLFKGICSRESALRSREKTLLNYHRCIARNLLEGGQTTRFTPGHKGRPREKMQAQTLLRLKSPEMIKARHPNGRIMKPNKTIS